MNVDFASINYIAVVVAAVATFFLGALWYSALFGKMWTRSQGFTDEQVAQMRANMNPAIFFGGMLIAYFIVAMVVAILVVSLNLTSPADGAKLGLLLWLGPAAAIYMTGHLASNKPFAAFAIDAGYQLIYLIGMGALLAAWR